MKNNFFKILLITSIFLISLYSALSADLMGISLDVKQSGLNLESGDIVVEIYDSLSSGTLIYNSTDDFLGNITAGKVDIMLGSGTVPLNLTYGYNYFMEIYVDGNEINFSGQDRQEFTSNLGNMTLSRISIDSDISPATNNTIDIGTNSTYFRNLFVSTLNILTKITTSQIANNAITSALIAQRTITSDDIADNAINTTHIEDSTITTDDISIDTIIAADIAAGAIGTSEILDETILPEDISSVGWTNLTDYPSACPAGQAITQIGDTITCAAVSSLDSEVILRINETDNINTTHIVDGTILAIDLDSTLDVANYTAGTGISVEGHVISSTGSSMDYTNIVLSNDSTTLDSTWDVSNYTAGTGISVDGHVITNLNPYDTANIAFTNQTNDFTEDVTIGGGVAAGGITLETDGDAFINGTLYLMGNLTNVEVDQLNVNGSVIPSFNNLFDLGSSSFRYNNLFVTTLDLATRIVNSQIGPNAINSTQIIDGSIAIEDLESTLDVTNYTAGSGISITDHVIASTGGGGGSGDLTNYATTNESTIFTDNVTIEGDLAINRGVNLTKYTSCTALETDASGNLVCGSDEGGVGSSPTPWQQGAGTMYNDSYGIRVGIGTSTPGTELEVVGAINATNITFADGSTQTSATSDNNSQMHGQNISGDWIGFQTDPSGILKFDLETTGVASSLEDGIVGDSKFTDNEDFYLTNNVTIEGNLTVIGDVEFANLNISGVQFTDGNVTADTFFGDGSQLDGIDVDNNSQMYGQNSDGDWIGLKTTSNGILMMDVAETSLANSLVDGANATINNLTVTGSVSTNLTIDDSLLVDSIYPAGSNIAIMGGNVGVNTTSPTSTLHVDGTMNATKYYGDGSGLTGVATTDTTNISLNYVQNSTGDWLGARSTAAGVMQLDITSLSAEKAIDNFTGTDSIITDYLYPNANPEVYLGGNLTIRDSINLDYIYSNSNPDTTLENITVLSDVHILGTLYGGSPLKIAGDINLTSGNIIASDGSIIISNDGTGNLTTGDSLITDYFYPSTNPGIYLGGNLTIKDDLIVTGNSYLQDFVFTANATFPDSILADYIFPNNNAVVTIQNLTVLEDVRALGTLYSNGADYAEQFVAGEELLPGTLVEIRENGKVYKAENKGIFIGIVSSKPALIGNSDLKGETVTVGLIGQLRVSTSSKLNFGDYITIDSSNPGLARKAEYSDIKLARVIHEINKKEALILLK